jgi:ribosomal-protein-alanine N-acetyltransferase
MNTTGKLEFVDLSSETAILIQNWDKQFFRRPWSKESWKSTDSKNHQLFAWKKNDQILGFALLGIFDGDEAAQLHKIMLLSEHQGAGESLPFITSIKKWLRTKGFIRLYLEVESTNLRAIGFYKKAGLQELRTIKGYYSDGTDGITMELVL